MITVLVRRYNADEIRVASSKEARAICEIAAETARDRFAQAHPDLEALTLFPRGSVAADCIVADNLLDAYPDTGEGLALEVLEIYRAQVFGSADTLRGVKRALCASRIANGL